MMKEFILKKGRVITALFSLITIALFALGNFAFASGPIQLESDLKVANQTAGDTSSDSLLMIVLMFWIVIVKNVQIHNV